MRDDSKPIGVLIPFLAGLLFGRGPVGTEARPARLNPLFGGSAFRTERGLAAHYYSSLNPLFGGSAFRTSPGVGSQQKTAVLIPFLAGLLFGRYVHVQSATRPVLIPFLAGLLFGPLENEEDAKMKCLNPLFGGSAFRTSG